MWIIHLAIELDHWVAAEPNKIIVSIKIQTTAVYWNKMAVLDHCLGFLCWAIDHEVPTQGEVSLINVRALLAIFDKGMKNIKLQIKRSKNSSKSLRRNWISQRIWINICRIKLEAKWLINKDKEKLKNCEFSWNKATNKDKF